MKSTAVWLVRATAICAGAVVCHASSTYRFEGPRNPQAVVDETATHYSLQIKLIPVSAFDPPTNDRLSSAKSRSVAFMALARHLKPPPTSELTVSGLEITDARMDGPLLVAQATVPRSGVQFAPRAINSTAVPIAESAGVAVHRETEDSALLTRAGDYLDSMRQLRDICQESIDRASSPQISDEVAVDLEQTISDKFAILGKEIDADLLLLTVERDEVRKEMNAACICLLKRLRQAVNAATVSSMTAEEPFATYLKADTMLLQYGGTRIVVLPQTNRTIIVSVASTAVRDNAASDRVRMQKVCRNKALAALLAHEKGLQVRYALETKDETAAVFRGGKEEVASLETTLETTSAQVEGFIQGLPVVGTWYSRDHDMFFLAVGRVTERSDNRGGTEQTE